MAIDLSRKWLLPYSKYVKLLRNTIILSVYSSWKYNGRVDTMINWLINMISIVSAGNTSEQKNSSRSTIFFNIWAAPLELVCFPFVALHYHLFLHLIFHLLLLLLLPYLHCFFYSWHHYFFLNFFSEERRIIYGVEEDKK